MASFSLSMLMSYSLLQNKQAKGCLSSFSLAASSGDVSSKFKGSNISFSGWSSFSASTDTILFPYSLPYIPDSLTCLVSHHITESCITVPSVRLLRYQWRSHARLIGVGIYISALESCKEM